MYWKRRYLAIPIFICRRDVKGAFMLIHVSIKGLAYMGCHFSVYMVLYLALFFGRRPSPERWGAISTLLMQYLAAYRPCAEHINGPEGFVDCQYVDDGTFAEPWLGLRPFLAVSLWGEAHIRPLGPNALNTSKSDVEWAISTNVTLWGIEVCTESETLTPPHQGRPRSRIPSIRRF